MEQLRSLFANGFVLCADRTSAALAPCHVNGVLYTQVFVGNLPPEAEARDLRDFFRDFGQINDAWVARKPPGFGFVWFEDERDAVFLTSSRPHYSRGASRRATTTTTTTSPCTDKRAH